MPPADLTGTVGVGRVELEVGRAAGTAIAPSPTDHAVPSGLAQALRDEPAEPRRSAGTVAEGAVGSAAEVTGAVEEALELFKAVSQGNYDRALTDQIDRLFDLMLKLNRDERWDDALRLSRALYGLLALTMRWVELVRSLRVALGAAERLRDMPAKAWVQHELGTLHLAADQPVDAERCLSEAHALREQLADRAGLAATDANLRVLCQRLRALVREGQLRPNPRRVSRVALAAAALVLLLLAGVAGAALKPDPEPEVEGIETAAEGPVLHQLTVHRSGAGGVTSAPAGISCSPTCDHAFREGDEVKLTPEPDKGATFDRWKGDCRGDVCRVTMNKARSVTAVFGSRPGTALLSVRMRGDGVVTSDPPGISCRPECSMAVELGTTVRLSAEAGEGSSIREWNVAGCSGSETCEVTVNTSQSVVAVFGPDEPSLEMATLSVVYDGGGLGTVTSEPTGMSCEASCTHDFPVGTEVTLTAEPAERSFFTGWTGSGCGDADTCTVTLDAAASVTARFLLEPE